MRMTEANGEAWYAAYTKHQHEKSAQHILALKGFEVLLPLYRATHRWKDRNKEVQLPVFPCYLFLRANLERKTDILRTPGVFGLVESAGQATEVPDTDMDMVRRIASGAVKVEPHAYLKNGDYVRVTRGPLADVEGILVRVKNQYRVVLAVEMLQKAVAIEVDLSVVERVKRVESLAQQGMENQAKSWRNSALAS
jgi:transcription antitermination factor NusG